MIKIKKWKVAIIGLLSVLLVVAVIIEIPDIKAKGVAKTYVLAWNTGKTADEFGQILTSIGTDDFVSKQISVDSEAYQKWSAGNLQIDIEDIYLIDKRETAEQAVVYYEVTNLDENYSSPMQANIILYKEGAEWKVQDAYLMTRSDQPIPKNAKAEEKIQTDRYFIFTDLVQKWTLTRNSGDIQAYSSYFSSTAPIDEYTKAYEAEQQTIAKDHISFSVASGGIFVLSSTDREAQILALIDQNINGTVEQVPLWLALVYEEDTWKIDRIYDGR